MRYSSAVSVALVASVVHGHGLVTGIQGANGVNMAGLSVIEGTPRNCASPLCGSEADTSIIRKNELGSGRASALGKTNGGGPVSADDAIAKFMSGGNGGGQQQQGGNQVQQQQGGQQQQQQGGKQKQGGGGLLGGLLGNIKRGLLDGLLGGSAGKGAQKAQKLPQNDAPAQCPVGNGEMPTCDDNGVVHMTYRQVNQDGAGPLTAMIDSTSGGKDPSAFVPAQMINDVPGTIAGLSGVSKTDFAISAQMPQGTVCQGSAGGVNNLCVMRLNNKALAGPFGGSVAFVQSPTNRKRAIEYNLRKRALEEKLAKRHFARGLSFDRE